MLKKKTNQNDKRKLFNVCLQYWRETKAAILITFAVSLPIVFATGGLGIDITNAYMARERLVRACDAAALATAASTSLYTEEAVRERFRNFVHANFPEERFGELKVIDIFPVPSDQSLVGADSLKGKLKLAYKTQFASVLGKEIIFLHAECSVKREVRGIEVALALDVTGSMQSNDNIGALRTATVNFINILFDRVEDHDDLRIGLVPYSATVNVGSIAPNIVSTIDPVPARPSVIYDPNDPLEWQGCVMARDYPHDYQDTHPNIGGYWDAFWYEDTPLDNEDNHWDAATGGNLNLPYNECNDRRTPNLGCPNPITPLTSDKNFLLAQAHDLKYWCRGGTLGNLGMTWAWRVLSPGFPFQQGANYEDPLWTKTIVMMTDGENQVWKKPGTDSSKLSDFMAYKRLEDGVLGTTNKGSAKDEVNDRMKKTCSLMKDKGITVYTVTFSTKISESTKDIFKRCATDSSKYFDAPSQDKLIEVFETIGKQISNLHISG